LVDVALVPTKLAVRSNGLILGLVILFKEAMWLALASSFSTLFAPIASDLSLSMEKE
jgi:hypothetical protein